MHLSKVSFLKFSLVIFCIASAPAYSSAAGQWSAGSCGADGFCTLIRVEHETSQKSPISNAGIIIGTIDSDGFKQTSVSAMNSKKTCRKEVRVPRVVFNAVTQMFQSVLTRGDQNALPASLTPAEQTMLLYYNTIMQQTMNFQCSN